MSSNPTAEQLEIRRRGRQRLIGAVALALAAVVFVPMLLDPEPRRERIEPVLAIPARNASALPEAAKAMDPAVTPASPSASEVPAPVAVPGPRAQERKTVEPKAREFKAASKAPTMPVAPAPKLEGFAVQVGAFKEDAKLAQAREKIAAARLAHYTERLDGASGELTRLRAGPFASRESAEKAAAQLKRAGLDARVVTLP